MESEMCARAERAAGLSRQTPVSCLTSSLDRLSPLARGAAPVSRTPQVSRIRKIGLSEYIHTGAGNGDLSRVCHWLPIHF